MVLELTPWMETLIELAPILYALGFFAVEQPLGYGIAGLVASMVYLGVGYGMFESQMFLILGGHLASWAFLGTIFSFARNIRGGGSNLWNAMWHGGGGPGAGGGGGPGAGGGGGGGTGPGGGGGGAGTGGGGGGGTTLPPGHGAIEGFCVEAGSNNPIPNVEVRVTGMPNVVRTDPNGRFWIELPALQWGTRWFRRYHLTFHHPNFDPPTDPGGIRIHPNHVTNLGRLSMRPATGPGPRRIHADLCDARGNPLPNNRVVVGDTIMIRFRPGPGTTLLVPTGTAPVLDRYELYFNRAGQAGPRRVVVAGGNIPNDRTHYPPGRNEARVTLTIPPRTQGGQFLPTRNPIQIQIDAHIQVV